MTRRAVMSLVILPLVVFCCARTHGGQEGTDGQFAKNATEIYWKSVASTYESILQNPWAKQDQTKSELGSETFKVALDILPIVSYYCFLDRTLMRVDRLSQWDNMTVVESIRQHLTAKLGRFHRNAGGVREKHVYAYYWEFPKDDVAITWIVKVLSDGHYSDQLTVERLSLQRELLNRRKNKGK